MVTNMPGQYSLKDQWPVKKRLGYRLSTDHSSFFKPCSRSDARAMGVIIVPPPSRRVLIKMCDEGIFETAGLAPTTLGWLVYENSFWKWVNKLSGEE